MARAHEARHVDMRQWYHSEKGGGFYIACQDWNFSFTADELLLFGRLWKEGLHLADIAEALKRPVREMVMLTMSLADEGKLRARTGGAYGEKKSNICEKNTLLI